MFGIPTFDLLSDEGKQGFIEYVVNLTRKEINSYTPSYNNVSAGSAIPYSNLNLVLSIVNADISTSAAIVYSKLDLALGIVNADISASAAIAYSKLALTGAILNADLAGSIADTKLSTIATALKVSNSATTAASTNTALAIVARDASGNFSAGTITAALTGNVTGNVTGSSGSTTGNAATVTTNANLTGDVTSVGNATSIASNAIVLGDLATALQAFLVPTATITPYAGSSAPTGWLLCDGSAVSQTTYAALYAIITSTYDVTAPGAGNFRVPDLRGNVPVGVKSTQTSNPDIRSLGKTAGAYTYTITANDLPLHSHAVGTLVTGAASATALTGILGSFDASHGHADSFAAPTHTHNIDHTHTMQVNSTNAVATGTSFRAALPTDSTISNRTTGTSAGSNSANSGGASSTTITGSVTNATTNTSAASLNHTHGVNSLAAPAHTHPITGSTGDNTTTATAVSLVQPVIALNFIIKT